VRAVAEVSKKEMNNLKTLRPARINLGFVGWIRINLTGYIQKYKISRGITKKKNSSYLNDEAVGKMKLYFIFLRKPVRLNPFLIVRLTPKLWIVSPFSPLLAPRSPLPASLELLKRI
jgi:hypothetical protein